MRPASRQDLLVEEAHRKTGSVRCRGLLLPQLLPSDGAAVPARTQAGPVLLAAISLPVSPPRLPRDSRCHNWYLVNTLKVQLQSEFTFLISGSTPA